MSSVDDDAMMEFVCEPQIPPPDPEKVRWAGAIIEIVQLVENMLGGPLPDHHNALKLRNEASVYLESVQADTLKTSS